jgi:hypothetical protein
MSEPLTIVRFAPRGATKPKGRILAIETSTTRARTLRRLFGDGYDVVIVKSSDEAIRSITQSVPDLVLTSALLPPRDEAALTACINRLPGAAHLQVITLPHFIDSEDAADRTAPGLLGYLRRRAATMRPGCNPETLREDIDTYFEQARSVRRLLASLAAVEPAPPVLEPPQTAMVLAPAAHRVTESKVEGRVIGWPSRVDAKDRRRARRHASNELSWLWSVTLPWDAPVAVIDLSRGGVLLETNIKITPGHTFDLRLIGENTDVAMPTRTTRSEVGSVDSRGVRYRVAAAFARNLEIPGLEPAAAPPMSAPAALAGLLARSLSEGGGGIAAARSRFERGLRQLLSVRDVTIRHAPIIPNEGSDSVYFRVPGTSGGEPVLQAIFDPGQQPSRADFRLLKTAANLAAVVLEFAPLEQSRVIAIGSERGASADS